MSSEGNRSTFDSAQNDIKGGIKMGMNAAKTAKTLTKVASQAASGNIAGAAVSLIKDPETLKKVLLVILIPVLCIVLIIVAFLYSLPTSIYEGVNSFFSEVKEEWNEGVYEDGDDVLWSSVSETIKTGGKIIAGTLSGKYWDSAKETLKEDGDSGSLIDIQSIDGKELYVMQSEEAEMFTLNNKIDAVIKKMDARQSEIQTSIYLKKEEIEQIVSSTYSSGYDKFNVVVRVNSNSLSREEAIELLSLYTVQTAGNVENQKLSDMMKWLGWYNSLDTGTTSFNLSDLGVSCEVKTWKGTFLPQYLAEQIKQEEDRFTKAVTKKEDVGCAAVDLLIVVDCPSISEIPVEVSTEYSVIKNNKGMNELSSKTVGTAYVDINIRARTPSTLASLAGLWVGDLSGDGVTDPGGMRSYYGVAGDGSYYEGIGIFTWPLPGHTKITSYFGGRTHPISHIYHFHDAIDISAPQGTPIVAAADGTVIKAGYSGGLGLRVVIDHGNGFVTRYAHMSSITTMINKEVKQGDVIGKVGSTGNSTGNHLDFNITYYGKDVDPMKYFSSTAVKKEEENE